MKKRSNLSIVVRAFGIGAIALTLYQPAVSAEVGKNVSREIAELRNVINFAEVYTVPTVLAFRLTLYERDVVAMGCNYSAVSKEDVDALFDVLANAQFTERPEEKFEPDTRTVIHLHTHDGTHLTIALSPEYLNAPAMGRFKETTPVVAKMGFGPDLLRWKKQRKPVRGSELMCRDE